MKPISQLLRILVSVTAKIILAVTVFFTTLFGMYAIKSVMTPVSIEIQPAANYPAKYKYFSVAIINSYNYNHICGKPQVDGFISQLHKYEDTTNVRFVPITYYMESKIKNVTKFLMQKQANLILKDIKRINPDFIYITDDNAFLYVGLRLIKQHKKVYFSGINFPFRYYKQFLSNDELQYASGVEEYSILDKLFTVLDHTTITITDVYILIDDQIRGSITNKAILTNIRTQLRKYDFHVTIYPLSTTTDLNKVLTELNLKNLGILFIVTQRLFDPSIRRYIDLLQICKIVSKINTKHIEVSFNPLVVQQANICLSISPNFYDMGKNAAKLLLHDLTTHQLQHIVKQTPTILTCSFSRLKQLHVEELYINNVDLFDKIF